MSPLFRGAQVPDKAMISAAAQRPVIVGIGGVVGVADGSEQHEADVVDLIQGRRQAIRGRMMLALPRECIRQLAPKPRQPWRR